MCHHLQTMCMCKFFELGNYLQIQKRMTGVKKASGLYGKLSMFCFMFSVMDGSLPKSLKHVISNAEYYGPSLFLLGKFVESFYWMKDRVFFPSKTIPKIEIQFIGWIWILELLLKGRTHLVAQFHKLILLIFWVISEKRILFFNKKYTAAPLYRGPIDRGNRYNAVVLCRPLLIKKKF